MRVCVVVPDGSMDDLVEQVVVQVGGRRKAQKLHSEGGYEAQSYSSCTQDNKHWQIVGVSLWTRAHTRTHTHTHKRAYTYTKSHTM